MPMTDTQKAMFLSNHEVFSSNELEQQIEEAKERIKIHGEMAESARLGYAPFGPSEKDLEHEIEQDEDGLPLLKMMYKLKKILELRNYTLIRFTSLFYTNNFFICAVLSESKEKLFFMYNENQYTVLNTQDFHTLRRYCDNHQDDF